MSPVRKKLFGIYRQSILFQSYPNWKVLMIGDKDLSDGKFTEIKSLKEDKIAKLECAVKYIENLLQKPDYVIRLDDDDMISPIALETASKIDFDCYADSKHHFYDLVYSDYSNQKRPWLANTVIHKTEHIFAKIDKSEMPLLVHDHNLVWHNYYADKKLVFAPKNEPVYLRTLSPITTTRGLEHNSHEKTNWEEYNQYLNSFGIWKKNIPTCFNSYEASLIELAKEFHATPKEKLSALTYLKKILKD
jgi:hypothetical protein